MDEIGAGRWRLILGDAAASQLDAELGEREQELDGALAALYDSDRRGGLARGAPSLLHWLDDIRRLFPDEVVHLLQHDAIERLDLHRMLLEPESLRRVEPDMELAATVVALAAQLPADAREGARELVGRVVERLRRRIEGMIGGGLAPALRRGARTRHPRPREIDWDATIRANLRTWRPELGSIIPERLVGYRRSGPTHRLVILVDASGSMARSLVHAAVVAAALASLRQLEIRLALFDVEVVDLTDELADPVSLLIGVTLGGGTDIAAALAWGERQIADPSDTTIVMISDLHHGGDRQEVSGAATSILARGARLLVLLALDERGAPDHDRVTAAMLAELGSPPIVADIERLVEEIAAAISRTSDQGGPIRQ